MCRRRSCVVRLYRPVGLKELRLIMQSGFRRFPPRLSWQPIFYPVLSFEYAAMIARQWNAQEDAAEHAGFVTRFDVADPVAARYPVQLAGGRDLQELWVPAEELGAFNDAIQGHIVIEAAFYGRGFTDEFDACIGLPSEIVAHLPTPGSPVPWQRV